jgi:hypothetical protein
VEGWPSSGPSDGLRYVSRATPKLRSRDRIHGLESHCCWWSKRLVRPSALHRSKRGAYNAQARTGLYSDLSPLFHLNLKPFGLCAALKQGEIARHATTICSYSWPEAEGRSTHSV